MKRILKSGLLVALAIAFASCTPPTAPLSSEKAITSFKFLDATNDALSQDYTATYNAISGAYKVGPLPAGTNVASLVATFEVSTGASLSVDGAPQTSGVTANDFTTDKTYTITAADGSTSTFAVSVSRTALGMTAFDVDGDTINLEDASVTIDDTASPRTIVVHVANHFSSDVIALKPTLTSNGTSVTVNGVAHVNGTSTYDFTNPVTFVVNGQSGVSESYQVSVVVDPVVTEALISAFSVTIDGAAYAGVIDDTANTITLKVPSGTSVSSLAPAFTASRWSTVTVSGAAQTSGTTTQNFSSAVDYLVTAEDASTTKTYTVSIAVNPVLAVITQACPSYSSVYAISGETWFDVKIPSLTALGSGWKIYTANNKTVNLVMSSSDLFTNFADGDTVRIIESSYTGTPNATADARPSSGLWVFKSAMSAVLSSYGVAWVELADGTVADILSYTSQYNTSGYWLAATTTWNPTATAPDAQTRLNEAVADGQWLAGNLSAAASLPDATNYILRLKDDSADGNSAADWEAYATPLLKASWAASPSSVKVTATASGSFLLTCTVSLYGGATAPTLVSADLSSITGAGLSAVALNDVGLEGDVTAGDGVYSYSGTLPAGTTSGSYSVPVSTTGSANATSSTVALSVVEYDILFSTGFEVSSTDITGITATGTTPSLTASGGFTAATTSGDITVNFGTFSSYPWVLVCPSGGKTAYLGTGSKISGTLGLGFNLLGQMLQSTATFTDPGVIKFYAKASGATTNNTVLIEYSTDGTTWTTFQTLTANGANTGTYTTTATLFSYDMSSLPAGAYYIRFNMSARTGGSFYIDDLLVAQR